MFAEQKKVVGSAPSGSRRSRRNRNDRYPRRDVGLVMVVVVELLLGWLGGREKNVADL